MADYTVGLPVFCLECREVHPYPNQHCRDCGHEVCAKCMGCNCDKALCDCAYSRG